MKTLLITILLFCSSSIVKGGEDRTIEIIRKQYYRAAESFAETKKLESLIEDLDSPNITILGYKAMMNMLKAKHSWYPPNKVDYFTAGKTLLETLIKLEPENVELAFMRFCVQSNAPFFLFYSANIYSDKALIKKKFPNMEDQDLKNRIKDYMLNEYSGLTQEETTIFKN